MTMNQPRQHTIIRIATVLLLLSTAIPVRAQTSAFTYQGRLSDGGTAANGNYDLQFALFDSLAGGAQVGSTQTISSVSVSAGIFSVSLDFGANAFPGANRFLEIRTRLTGAPSFTTLSPRQQISSTPYAIRSLNASTADTVAVNGVPSGSGNYIQSNPASQQAGNFNISGNGTASGTLSANIVNANTQYNLGGTRLISNQGGNLFVGNGAGPITTGSSNSFFGTASGEGNTTGEQNSFFGELAGSENSIGSQNSFFGAAAGLASQGHRNSFFGNSTAAFDNRGSDNSFFGFFAGIGNSTGSRNTLLGTESDVGLGDLTNATAIGANARVDQSNSLVLGSIATVNGATSSVNVGIGVTRPQATLDVRGTTLVSGNLGINIGPTNAPQSRLHVVGSSWFQGDNTPLPPTAGKGIVMGFGGEQGYIQAFDYTAFTGKNLLLNNSGGNVGIGTSTPLAQLHVNGAALVTTGSNREVSIGTPNGESGIVIKGTSNRADVRFDGTTLKLVAEAGTGPPASTSGIAITTVGNVGIGTTSPLAKLDVVGGFLRLDQLAGGGGETLCRNLTFHTITNCSSSSLRYKKNVQVLHQGLNLIELLRPVTFNWKDDGRADLGLIAEEVADAEPLLTYKNAQGEIEGVRYDRLNVVLINAIKQQQQQIDTLRAENAALNTRLLFVERRMRKQRKAQPR